MDLHKAQIQGFFDIPVDHLFAAPVIIDYLSRLEYPDLTIVSPDAGGAERARAYAKRLDAELAIIDKRRTDDGTAEVMNVIGDVAGRTCIIQDDIIDTAGTITKAAGALKEAGAERVFACAVHGVLSGPALERIERAPIDQLIMTNTIPLSRGSRALSEDQGAVGGAVARSGDQEHPRGDVGVVVVRVKCGGSSSNRQTEGLRNMEAVLEASPRSSRGKNEARRLRASGKIPAVVYGGRASREGRP